MQNNKTKRNLYISYLKGFAIISIILIHLIDWSNRFLSAGELYFKELLYPAVLFFIATSGSVVYLAYAKYDLRTAAKKLFRRGGELIAVYFLYNIIKLYIYNFSHEPFYEQFAAAGQLDLAGVLSLKVFTSPITIILTIGALLIIAPLFLYLAKNKFGKSVVGLLIIFLIYLNYFLPLPANVLTDFLYSKNNVTFPFMLWLLPFLIGFYLSMLGLEKHKGKFLLIFMALTIICAWPIFNAGQPLKITGYMYPLKLYYLFFSFAFMYFLIYIFYFLEQVSGRAANYFLASIRLLGDSTLAIYVYHWIVIDATLWIFYPRIELIWLTVPLFLACYIILKSGKFMEYLKYYE